MGLGVQHSLSCELEKVSSGISHYLRKHLFENGRFSARTFYAEAFTLGLLSLRGELSSQLVHILQKCLEAKDQNSQEFHGEFLQYPQVEWKGYPLKNHTVTNWILLKSLLLVRHQKGGYEEAKRILAKRQTSYGLIKDDKDVRSLQYHCFSLALLYELWQETGDEDFQRRFNQGLGFIKKFILSDGSSLYIGRGQEQLFGYASLVYVLSVSGEYDLLERVFSFLMGFRRGDGSLPLVLRKNEAKDPFEPDLNSDQYLGWYGYNNYFDYLAFAGYFFQKSLNIFQEKFERNRGNVETKLDESVFRVVSKDLYQAVLASPEGPLANGLPMPLIVSRQHGRLTPCFGGEQVLPSLAKEIDVPMPYFPHFQKSLCKKSISWMNKDSLFTLSPLGYMKRSYQFAEDGARVHTSVVSPFKFVHQYLFFDDVKQVSEKELEGKGYRIRSNQPLTFNREVFCPVGKVKVFTSETRKSSLTLQLIDE